MINRRLAIYMPEHQCLEQALAGDGQVKDRILPVEPYVQKHRRIVKVPPLVQKVQLKFGAKVSLRDPLLVPFC